jgi:hypothetical protein
MIPCSLVSTYRSFTENSSSIFRVKQVSELKKNGMSHIREVSAETKTIYEPMGTNALKRAVFSKGRK